MQRGFKTAGVFLAELFAAAALSLTTPVNNAQTPSGGRAPPQAIALAREAHEAKRAHAAANAQGTSNNSQTGPHGIMYGGGPIMLGTVNLYYIFYGNWDDPSKSIVEDFAKNIGGSPYLNIQRSYYDGSLKRIANSVRYAGSTTDNYSQGSTNVNPALVVVDAIKSGKLGPADPNGVYFVLGADGVSPPGFLTSYCGYHGNVETESSTPMLVNYAFVGNPGFNGSCSVQTLISPNNDPGVDAAINTIAHELNEMMNDPKGNAWSNANGESADNCAWTFGLEQTASNGSAYNVTLGSRQYLIQQNFVNDGSGYCAMQWPAPVPSGWVYVANANSGKYLEFTSTEKGAVIEQHTFSGNFAQMFSFAPVNGGYKITSRVSGLQLDVRGGPAATGDGALIQQWPFGGGSNELFGLSAPNTQGYGIITAFNSAKVLVVSGRSTADNAPIIQWDYTGVPNQNWKLVPVTPNGALEDPIAKDLASPSTSKAGFAAPFTVIIPATDEVTDWNHDAPNRPDAKPGLRLGSGLR